MKKLFISTLLLLATLGYAVTVEEIQAMPTGKERNGALVEFYSTSCTNSSLSKLFSAPAATREECLSFYELVMKNTELTTDNVVDLSWIKSQYLKLSY